jgi:hypothetical protein
MCLTILVPASSIKVGKSDLSNAKLPFNVKVKNIRRYNLLPHMFMVLYLIKYRDKLPSKVFKI